MEIIIDKWENFAVRAQNEHLRKNFCGYTLTPFRACAYIWCRQLIRPHADSATCGTSLMEVSWFVTDSIMRGHHVYKDRWIPRVGETLQCLREVGNREDRFAVGVYKDRDIVSHVPRNISTQYISSTVYRVHRHSILRSISVTRTQ